MNKVLVICGVSGSGKSTLESNLISTRPELFHKWPQVTTRPKRPNESFGNPYLFLQEDTYDHIEEKLVGRLGNKPDSHFQYKYGSFPDFVSSKVSTVILAKEAIEDLLETAECWRGTDLEIEIFVVGIDIGIDEIPESARREGRNDEFLAHERTVFRYANHVFKVANGDYISVDQVVDLLNENKFIEA